MMTETDEILERVPLALRNAHDAAWDAYASTCCTGGTKEQRAYAYETARKAQEKFNTAVVLAQAELKREENRSKAEKVRG